MPIIAKVTHIIAKVTQKLTAVFNTRKSRLQCAVLRICILDDNPSHHRVSGERHVAVARSVGRDARAGTHVGVKRFKGGHLAVVPEHPVFLVVELEHRGVDHVVEHKVRVRQIRPPCHRIRWVGVLPHQLFEKHQKHTPSRLNPFSRDFVAFLFLIVVRHCRLDRVKTQASGGDVVLSVQRNVIRPCPFRGRGRCIAQHFPKINDNRLNLIDVHCVTPVVARCVGEGGRKEHRVRRVVQRLDRRGAATERAEHSRGSVKIGIRAVAVVGIGILKHHPWKFGATLKNATLAVVEDDKFGVITLAPGGVFFFRSDRGSDGGHNILYTHRFATSRSDLVCGMWNLDWNGMECTSARFGKLPYCTAPHVMLRVSTGMGEWKLVEKKIKKSKSPQVQATKIVQFFDNSSFFHTN